MKIKNLLIVVVFGVLIYYFFNKKMYKSSSKPCLDCETDIENDMTSSEIITEIVQKNKEFLAIMARRFEMSFDEIDLTWLKEKTPKELKELLSMSTEDFKQQVLQVISLE